MAIKIAQNELKYFEINTILLYSIILSIRYRDIVYDIHKILKNANFNSFYF